MLKKYMTSFIFLAATAIYFYIGGFIYAWGSLAEVEYGYYDFKESLYYAVFIITTILLFVVKFGKHIIIKMMAQFVVFLWIIVLFSSTIASKYLVVINYALPILFVLVVCWGLVKRDEYRRTHGDRATLV